MLLSSARTQLSIGLTGLTIEVCVDVCLELCLLHLATLLLAHWTDAVRLLVIVGRNMLSELRIRIEGLAAL